MGPVEALELALSKEEDALKTYRRLAIEHVAVKDIFELLANEEEKHRKLLQERIVKMTRG